MIVCNCGHTGTGECSWGGGVGGEQQSNISEMVKGLTTVQQASKSNKRSCQKQYCDMLEYHWHLQACFYSISIMVLWQKLQIWKVDAQVCIPGISGKRSMQYYYIY